MIGNHKNVRFFSLSKDEFRQVTGLENVGNPHATSVRLHIAD